MADPTLQEQRARLAARALLIRRLTERHEMTTEAALQAVLDAERGTRSPQADLARAEARAFTQEALAPLVDAFQRLREAARPIAQAWAETLRQLAEHLNRAGLTDRDTRPRCAGRPAWQSPYGPPPRKGRRR
ncbi:hypothetical protein [Streptomyces sp. NBC_00557]|uniref:hypothetical protein n=1 Tax=Streptomyces sp. NBC_00557 TaxID=2975776 RepID=UPI002E80CDE3|nr:hypothetical protein [Streptomyces sp. NBC_00557]WUC36365.1 hypothetical protein OG956_20150 [Streptomyces sp. NBC_00557]